VISRYMHGFLTRSLSSSMRFKMSSFVNPVSDDAGAFALSAENTTKEWLMLVLVPCTTNRISELSLSKRSLPKFPRKQRLLNLVERTVTKQLPDSPKLENLSGKKTCNDQQT